MSMSQQSLNPQGSRGPARESRCLIVRGEGYGVVEVSGTDRVKWLHGLTSNEVKKLRPGEGNYALFITGKGKMIAEAWVLCLEDRFLVVSRPEHRARVAQTLDRYLLMDDVTLVDASASFRVLGVHGELATELLGALLGLEEPPAREGHHTGSTIRGVAVQDYGHPGYLILAPPPWTQWKLTEGLPLASEADLETLRIEHGIPRWGAELDDETIPIEAGLEARAISYDKGCYVGQEIIARIKTYGEVAKKLWGVRWSGEGVVAPRTAFLRDAADVGWVTSSTVSPTFGSISLAYVKRGHGEAGAEVRTSDGRIGALAPLPFAR